MTQTVRTLLITMPDEEKGATLAKTLVEERLVACVNIVPKVRSIYRWQGKVEDAAETLLICKTAPDRVSALLTRVPELHPYTVPEVLVLPVEVGLSAYCDWVVDETRPLAF
jgi:periplasmic divalent cation tolerance protein